MLRLKIVDANGEVPKDRPFKLDINGEAVEGTVPEGGMIEKEIPVDCDEASLTLWLRGDPDGPGYVRHLKIGHLDPENELTGVQARLANLGYFRDPVDGQESETLSNATAAFRKKHELDGEGIDDALISKLKDEHGS